MRQHTQRQWHLDEVFAKINGVQHYLWRAVDHEGEVLESFVTKNRDKGITYTIFRTFEFAGGFFQTERDRQWMREKASQWETSFG